MPGARPSAGFPPATDADPAPEESCARENGLTLGELQRGAKNVLRLALASGANPFLKNYPSLQKRPGYRGIRAFLWQ